MELVEGITLKELLASGNKLVPERALEITSGVLAALDYSHRHGIVHRDIKPGNVMLTTTGAVKVMDFGIARATADAGQTGTSTSTVMGTAAYLSPEQAQGLTVDSRSDLYSAGVVLFELLTRRPPFVADAPVAVAFAHVNEPPPVPSTLDPTLPPQLDPIVARALAKDPAQRYQTAVEFRADVERAIAGVPVTRVMPLPPLAGADSQATSVIGGVDPYATAAMAATGAAAATGAMPPVIPGGAGDPYAAPDLMTTTAQNDPPRKGGVLKGLGIAVLVIALMGAGVWLGLRMWNSNTPATVEVPPVEGLTVTKAEAVLRDAGLLLGGPEVKVSDLPKDTIISQDPRKGELVKAGSTVDVVVSAGKAQVQVPTWSTSARWPMPARPWPMPGWPWARSPRRTPTSPRRRSCARSRRPTRPSMPDRPSPSGCPTPRWRCPTWSGAPRPRPARTCSTRASRSPTTTRWRPRSSLRAPSWTRHPRAGRTPRRAPW